MFNWLKRRINSWIEKREKIAEAKKVYRNCRGTHHKQMLEEDITRLEKILSEKQEEKSKTNQKRQKIRENLNSKINKKAFRRYFKENYDSIEGVGEKYSQKLLQKITRTSNSSWSDLEHMGKKIINRAKSIKGIGQKTYSALKDWHYQNGKDIERLSKKMKNDEEIFSDEKEKLEKLQQKIRMLKEEINELKELKKKPESALKKLQKTSVNDFVKAKIDPENNSQSAKKVNQYLKGLYPQWGDPPSWYNDVQTVLKNKNTKSLKSNSISEKSDFKKAVNRIKQKSQ